MSDPTSHSETESAEEKSLDQLLADAQAKIEEQRNAWLRALADADNARKRAQADIAQARRFAVERFVEDLLPVLDGLEAALATPSENNAALRSGVELTLKLLRTAIERAGVTEVAPAPGERFDPHRHQAMAAVESDAEPNTVVNVMQKGYLLHDRVVRAALVTVAKAKPANDPAQA
ncbi:MAG TPA: nucleotide exchange factor GrpE [Burkholderiales bacterium]|jgi:molecular chaperone GrpE|nr:nucleotide exchange factor GrpE [Burkholderiales bacterium]